VAEYLNTKYKGDQFVNFVKNHESTQPNMNSVVKLAAKFIYCSYLNVLKVLNFRKHP
jgi:hypothetical protein